MNLFAPADHDQLVAPPEQFDGDRLRDEHGDWGHQLLRASTALEMLAQITQRLDPVLVKGGTLLQSDLAWPPYRASVDLDLEAPDADDLKDVLAQIEDTFAESELGVDVSDSPLPGFIAHARFPHGREIDWSLRIDVLEHDVWPDGTSGWTTLPQPWKKAEPPQAAPAEVRAAQKLLMAAEPLYGRDLADHLGRQNFVKDLFDLRCLGELTLDDRKILDAAREDVDRKSGYLGQDFVYADLLDDAAETLSRFAHPPVNDDSLRGSLWRAYDRVKSSIRIPFTRAAVRASAGCAHHAIQALQRDEMDWDDTWRPAIEQAPRAAWTGKEIRPVLEVEDGYGPTAGVLEAWAGYEP